MTRVALWEVNEVALHSVIAPTLGNELFCNCYCFCNRGIISNKTSLLIAEGRFSKIQVNSVSHRKQLDKKVTFIWQLL